METVTAPSNPFVHGGHPPSHPGEGEENFEKKPVLKKVKDKVKKIKSTITKKARSHGGDGNNDDDDRNQHGDLDEGDDGYEEDEEQLEDPAVHGGQNIGSSTVDVGIGAKERGSGVGNVGVFGSSTEAARAGEQGTGFRGGTEGVHGSYTTGERSGPIGTRSGGETAGLYGSSTAGKRNGFDEPRTGGGAEETHGVFGSSTAPGARAGGGTEVNSVGLSGIKPELKEDPAAPNSSTRTEMEQSRGGEEAKISPDLLSSLEAIGTSHQNGSGSKDLSDDNNRGNAAVNPRAHETGGNGGAISPELHRSFDAMSVSDPIGGGEAEVPENKKGSYADKIAAAKDAALSAASESAVYGKKVASMVYDKAAGAGTAVMAKVKPETGNEGVKPETTVKENRDVAAGKQQDKGVSVKDYVSGKLTPGEEDKALSEVITEALTPRKGETVETAAPTSPDKSGSGGIGVVGRIKETVTSFLGGGGGSPREETRAADESKDFLGRTPEALSHEKAL